jgi:hypothetical protein
MQLEDLKTSDGIPIVIKHNGLHNENAGPDFFNAQLRIGGQLWAGNLEIHIKSSDWYLHNHEQDSAYDNVILHVVWEHDTEIFRKDNSIIPTLVLQQYVSTEALLKYNQLFQAKQQWISCEKNFPFLDDFRLQNWLERLFIERLERKSLEVFKLLEASKNNWEAVLFKMLAKNFGLKVNGDAFLSMANSFDFSILRKVQHNALQLEALLFGQSHLLEETLEEPYHGLLKQNYKFLQQKFSLNTSGVTQPLFFRLRPYNFPTIRLSQLAHLYHKHQNVFSRLVDATTTEAIYKVFNVQTASFWETHFTFTKVSKVSRKAVSKAFIDLLIINTIIPVKFAYAKYKGHSNADVLFLLLSTIPSEKNSTIDRFNSLQKISKTALHSQALLQLKTEYCNKKKCLKCAIGTTLITN